MRRVARLLVPAMMVVFALPRSAMAAEQFSSAGLGVHVGLSLLGLIIAVILLVEALGVRKLALGGAIADKISLVLLAVFCLAASALAEWGTNFVMDLTLEQVQLASEVLVLVAMALLAAYFWTVRAGMKRYLTEVTHACPGVGDATVSASTGQDERV